MMFAPFCPTHDATVLMTRRNVKNFWNGPDGPVIHWKCTCGHEGITGRTGDAALDRASDNGASIAELRSPGPLSARGRTSSGHQTTAQQTPTGPLSVRGRTSSGHQVRV